MPRSAKLEPKPLELQITHDNKGEIYREDKAERVSSECRNDKRNRRCDTHWYRLPMLYEYIIREKSTKRKNVKKKLDPPSPSCFTKPRLDEHRMASGGGHFNRLPEAVDPCEDAIE